MRDVNSGWLLRFIHCNGASFFFAIVYAHIGRAFYYGSFAWPRYFLWASGVVIFLLMMATAFMGYVLPWGQMSFWGATVITNLFSAIPAVGDNLAEWLWGGFSVDNPTLNRFFGFHFIAPFAIAGLVCIHLVFLHTAGSSDGLTGSSKQDRLPFYPYFYAKDLVGVLFIFLLFSFFVFFSPDSLGHPDNYIEGNALVTPAHIVPEWYFLPFYAMLRAVPNKLGGVVCMILAIVLLLCIPVSFQGFPSIQTSLNELWIIVTGFFFSCFLILGWLGSQPVELTYVIMGQNATLFYFLILLFGFWAINYYNWKKIHATKRMRRYWRTRWYWRNPQAGIKTVLPLLRAKIRKPLPPLYRGGLVGLFIWVKKNNIKVLWDDFFLYRMDDLWNLEAAIVWKFWGIDLDWEWNATSQFLRYRWYRRCNFYYWQVETTNQQKDEQQNYYFFRKEMWWDTKHSVTRESDKEVIVLNSREARRRRYTRIILSYQVAKGKKLETRFRPVIFDYHEHILSALCFTVGTPISSTIQQNWTWIETLTLSGLFGLIAISVIYMKKQPLQTKAKESGMSDNNKPRSHYKKIITARKKLSTMWQYLDRWLMIVNNKAIMLMWVKTTIQEFQKTKQKNRETKTKNEATIKKITDNKIRFFILTGLSMLTLVLWTVLWGVQNIVLYFLILELLSILPLFFLTLTAMRINVFSSEIALKYLALNIFTGSFFLLGSLGFYWLTGSLYLNEIANYINGALLNIETIKSVTNAKTLEFYFAVCTFLFLAPLMFKLGFVPFHWLINDIYRVMPLSQLNVYASFYKLGASLTILQLLLTYFKSALIFAGVWFLMVTATTIVVCYAALKSIKNLKAVLGYLSTATAVFLFIPTFTNAHFWGANTVAETAFVSGSIQYAISVFTLISLLQNFNWYENWAFKDLTDLEGLTKSNTNTRYALGWVLFNMCGAPPTITFWYKYNILEAATDATGIILTIMFLAFQVFFLFTYLSIFKPIFNDTNALRNTAATKKPKQSGKIYLVKFFTILGSLFVVNIFFADAFWVIGEQTITQLIQLTLKL